MLDPVSRVFLASTGQPIDGAVDRAGRRQRCAGARMRATTVRRFIRQRSSSGTDVVDAGGTHYTYAPRRVSFPVARGRAPINCASRRRTGSAFRRPRRMRSIQAIAGAPYALSGASRGAAFTIAGGSVVARRRAARSAAAHADERLARRLCVRRGQAGRDEPVRRRHAMFERRFVRAVSGAGEPRRCGHRAGPRRSARRARSSAPANRYSSC